MNNFIHYIVIPTVIFGSLFSVLHAKAAPDSRAFGEQWQPKPALVNDQAEVVYYRTQASDSQRAALVTVNGKLHAALLPGMYTRICVQPGRYTLGGWMDSPDVQMAAQSSFQTMLKAGKTYFVRVDAHGDGKPQPVRRTEAERELAELRLQQHVLSRADAVTECRYQSEPLVSHTSR